MFSPLRGLFSIDLAIDLGTTNTRVYVRDKGIVLDEPSVVAIRHDPRGARSNRSILAIGEAAKRMLGRTPGNIQVIRPMKDGVIADFTVTGEMLRYSGRLGQPPMLLRGEIYIGVFLSETVAVKERVKQNVVEQPRLPWIQLE